MDCEIFILVKERLKKLEKDTKISIKNRWPCDEDTCIKYNRDLETYNYYEGPILKNLKMNTLVFPLILLTCNAICIFQYGVITQNHIVFKMQCKFLFILIVLEQMRQRDTALYSATL